MACDDDNGEGVGRGGSEKHHRRGGLLIACRKAGISYTKADGEFKGKSELEAELALLNPEKSALDKFKALLNSANAVADHLSDLEAITASALVNDLLTKVAAKIKAAA